MSRNQDKYQAKSDTQEESDTKTRTTSRVITQVVVPIAVAVIGVIGLVLAAIINNWFQCCLPPTPTSTATLTDTAAPLAEVTDTPAPIPTDTLTPTATPTWLARITYPKLALDPPVTRFVDLIGEYRADVTDDIWVWIQDPSGKYFPASMKPCEGQSTPKFNGKWEIFAGVGVEDSRGVYNVVLTIATPAANKFISDALKDGCKTGIFPGYPGLPPGITEVERASVTREPVTGADDTYPQAPLLPDARLPGLVSVAPIGINGTVIAGETITGAVSGATDTVWTLVYTFYGLWYPQSINPCNGVHTLLKGGDQWETRAVFGNDQDVGRPFSAVTVLANAEANRFLDTNQQQSCAVDKYSGFLTIELPDGLSVKQSTRVIRR